MRLENFWENPRLVSMNREAPRSWYIPFQESHPDGDPLKRTESQRVMLLNGGWKFRLFPAVEELPEGFYKAGFDAESWYRRKTRQGYTSGNSGLRKSGKAPKSTLCSKGSIPASPFG